MVAGERLVERDEARIAGEGRVLDHRHRIGGDERHRVDPAGAKRLGLQRRADARQFGEVGGRPAARGHHPAERDLGSRRRAPRY